MKFLLIILFVLPIIELSRSIGCQSNFTVFDKMFHGIDVTKLELFPEDITKKQEGIVGHILDFKCDKHKKWQNIHNKNVYELPDLIESITNLPGKVEQKTEIFLNSSDLTKADKARCKMVTSNLICHPLSYLMENWAAVTFDISLFTVKLALPRIENALPAMKTFFNQLLPNNYLENPGKYQEFLTNFGTHFFQTATYGGVLQISAHFSKDYALKHTMEALKAQTNLLLMKQTGQGNQSPDKEFMQGYGAYYYGGNDADLTFGKLNISSWSSSVSSYPWLIGGHLEPISTLLPNGPKKIAMNTAIDVKLDYAYLDDLSLSLQFLKKYPKSPINFAAVNSFTAQVNAERVKVVPPHDRVLQLGAAVEGFFNVEKEKIIN